MTKANALQQNNARIWRRAANAALTAAVTLGFGVAATQSAKAQTFTVLYTFTGGSDGSTPEAGLVRDTAGNLYSTTYQGGDVQGGDVQDGDVRCSDVTNGCGVVFKLNTTGKETVLHTFLGGPSDGANPAGGLVRDAQGNFYGTTNYGHEPAGYGTVFEFSKTGKETVLHAFSGGSSDGANPLGGLIRDNDGNLYGTTIAAGSSDNGTIFKVSKAGKETVLHSFAGYPSDGANPTLAGVVMDKDGNLYGVTYFGGRGTRCPGGCGTLYKLSKNGGYTVLHSFTGGKKDGCWPYGTPVIDANGNLYGTAVACGPSNAGIVWRVSKKGTETVLHNFAGGSSDGGYPEAGVIMDAQGNLYGDTTGGGDLSCNIVGDNGCGVVYELNTKGVLTLLHAFSGPDGAFPCGVLMRDADGTFYGTASGGGTGGGAGNGTVWKLTP
ncbi:MAG: choice-of-anchor tandem repeat GloVer-containing protein [Terriglobales bacterium]